MPAAGANVLDAAQGTDPGDSRAQLERLADGLNSLTWSPAYEAGRTPTRRLLAARPEPLSLGQPLLVRVVGQVVQGQHEGPPRQLSGNLPSVPTVACRPGADHAVRPRLAH